MLAIGNSHIKLPNPEWAMGCGACNSWFCFAAFRVFSTMTWWSHFGKVDSQMMSFAPLWLSFTSGLKQFCPWLMFR